jgi:nucleotide-binding universal stress UspA family protein
VLHEAIEKAKEPGQDLKDSVTGSEHHQEEENPAHGSSHQAEDLGESFMKSAHGVEEAKEEVLHEAIEKAKEPGQDLKDSVTGSEHHQEEKPAQDAKEEL